LDETAKSGTLKGLSWAFAAALMVFSAYTLMTNIADYNAPQRSHTLVQLEKYRIEGDQKYLWAKGPKDPKQESSEWFDLSDSPLPVDKFQYGIGRDRIPSIDDPVFVTADDPRLRMRYGLSETADIGKVEVFGYVHNGVAKAYPTDLLDRHELVNDVIGGKPVTVGW
jgi:Protein of unknown function (DUF3179)